MPRVAGRAGREGVTPRSPRPFGDEVDAGRDLVRFVPVAFAVGCGDVVECVGSAAADRGDVVDGEAQRVEVVCLVVDVVAADVAWWLVFGDDASMSVSSSCVAHVTMPFSYSSRSSSGLGLGIISFCVPVWTWSWRWRPIWIWSSPVCVGLRRLRGV